MKPRSIGFSGAIWLSLFVAAKASDAASVIALNFNDRNTESIQARVSNPDTCADLVRAAITAHARRARIIGAETIADVRVIGGCQTVSFNHDGNLQIIAMADLENGDGPLNYVAVYKRSGLLDEAEIPIGEGNGALGPVKVFLHDIDHNGHLELIEKSRVTIVEGRMIANVDPAPVITHVYVWRNNTFTLADTEYRHYFVSTVLPDMQVQLEEAQLVISAPADAEKNINSIKKSIWLMNKFVQTGHY